MRSSRHDCTWPDAIRESVPDPYPARSWIASRNRPWVADPATFEAVRGTVAFKSDPATQTQKLAVSGSATGQGGSTTWDFTKD